MPSKIKKFALPVIFALVALVAFFTYRNYMHVSTDNAQISAHFLMLSSRVNGTISKVFVEDHQKVKAGEILAQIDTSDYSNAKTAAQAGLNESYTRIIAPSDGIIAKKSVEPGQFVPAGQPLFGFVSENKRWVVANLKETELKNVKLGQKVKVEVDAVSGKHFEGKVVSISPSTGAVFSLLPPDNATGNFTKVVQRVPVKIDLENLSEEDVDALQVGLSAEVSIQVH